MRLHEITLNSFPINVSSSTFVKREVFFPPQWQTLAAHCRRENNLFKLLSRNFVMHEPRELEELWLEGYPEDTSYIQSAPANSETGGVSGLDTSKIFSQGLVLHRIMLGFRNNCLRRLV